MALRIEATFHTSPARTARDVLKIALILSHEMGWTHSHGAGHDRGKRKFVWESVQVRLKSDVKSSCIIELSQGTIVIINNGRSSQFADLSTPSLLKHYIPSLQRLESTQSRQSPVQHSTQRKRCPVHILKGSVTLSRFNSPSHSISSIVSVHHVCFIRHTLRRQVHPRVHAAGRHRIERGVAIAEVRIVASDTRTRVSAYSDVHPIATSLRCRTHPPYLTPQLLPSKQMELGLQSVSLRATDPSGATEIDAGAELDVLLHMLID